MPQAQAASIQLAASVNQMSTDRLNVSAGNGMDSTGGNNNGNNNTGSGTVLLYSSPISSIL